VKRRDLLAEARQRLELQKAEGELAKKCKHPHLLFQNYGFRLRCVDCKRFWNAGLKVNKLESNVADAGYWNPEIQDGEPRHSPMEAPRIAPLPKKIP
jgi:hypothetical protein